MRKLSRKRFMNRSKQTADGRGAAGAGPIEVWKTAVTFIPEKN
jgi:hypothetical protein